MTTDATFRPPPRLVRLAGVLAGVGVATYLAGAFVAPMTTAASLLVVGLYLLGLGLGGALFLALHHLTGARWSRPLLSVPASLLPLIALGGGLVLVVLLFHPSLYPWNAPDPSEAHAPTAWFREAWLWRPGLLARSVGYLIVWIVLAAWLKQATFQPTSGSNPVRAAAVFTVVFAITCWLSSCDWAMSLEPEWSSTVYGVYHFAGIYLSVLAATILLLAWLRPRTALRHTLTTDHFHDLGRLLFGFSSFWMYIGFCQYMLIWYVNNPEETSYYVRRLTGAWGPLFLVNILLGWVVPFLVLMSARAKRNLRVLVEVALVVLVGRWLDLFLMVYPPVLHRAEGWQAPGLAEVGLALGGVGAALLVVLRGTGTPARAPVGQGASHADAAS